MFFCIGVSAFRKKSLIKDSMCGAENVIFLYMVYKAVFIIIISNEYHQFRVWCKFVGTNFIREEYIGSIAKDIEVQCFRFVLQKYFLRYFPLEMSDRYTIVYMSHSCYCKLLLGIW